MRGDDLALDGDEIAGFNLYRGKAKCATCHYMPLFNLWGMWRGLRRICIMGFTTAWIRWWEPWIVRGILIEGLGGVGEFHSSVKCFFRRAKMNVRRKNFNPGAVFLIFVSATKEIQILKNLPHPNPKSRYPNLWKASNYPKSDWRQIIFQIQRKPTILTFEKQLIIQIYPKPRKSCILKNQIQSKIRETSIQFLR